MTRLAALLITLAVCTHALADSQRAAEGSTKVEAHGPVTRNSPQSDQRGTEQAPLAIELVQSKASEEQEASEARNAENQTSAIIEANKITRWLAGATIALAFFALWQVIESRRSSRRQIDIAIAQQRASISAVGLNYFYFAVEKSKPRRYEFRFRVHLRNSGTTPTKNLRMKATCILSNQQWDEKTPLDYGPQPEGAGMIPPQHQMFGGETPLRPHFPAISVKDVQDVQAGTKFLYILGWVKYKDVFPGTPWHTTKYCWQIVPVGNPAVSAEADLQKMRFDYLQHITGNDNEDEEV